MAAVEEDDRIWAPLDSDLLIGSATQESFMRTVILTVESEPMDFPLNSPDGGKWRIGVKGSANESQDLNSTMATFVLPAGDYSGMGQRMDTSGTPIGPIATADFIVADLMKQIDVAKTLTVTLV